MLALIERQRDGAGGRIQSMLDDQPDDSAEQKIRKIVRILHEAFTVHRMPERRLALALLQIAVARGLPAAPNIAVQAMIRIWAGSGAADSRPLNESEAFVLTRSAIEVLRQAALQSSSLLGTAEFEDAILRMILDFSAHHSQAEPDETEGSRPAPGRDRLTEGHG